MLVRDRRMGAWQGRGGVNNVSTVQSSPLTPPPPPCLTQFTFSSPLRHSLSIIVFFSLLLLSSLFSIQLTKLHRLKLHSLSFPFVCFVSVCVSMCVSMKYFFHSNPGGPAPTTPTHIVCVALDIHLSIYASGGCRLFDNDLTRNICG